jgi:hypothetical protein
MGVAADAGGLQPGFLQRREDLVPIHAPHRFHAFESGFFHDTVLFQHRAFHTDCGMHDRLAQFTI